MQNWPISQFEHALTDFELTFSECAEAVAEGGRVNYAELERNRIALIASIAKVPATQSVAALKQFLEKAASDLVASLHTTSFEPESLRTMWCKHFEEFKALAKAVRSEPFLGGNPGSYWESSI